MTGDLSSLIKINLVDIVEAKSFQPLSIHGVTGTPVNPSIDALISQLQAVERASPEACDKLFTVALVARSELLSSDFSQIHRIFLLWKTRLVALVLLDEALVQCGKLVDTTARPLQVALIEARRLIGILKNLHRVVETYRKSESKKLSDSGSQRAGMLPLMDNSALTAKFDSLGDIPVYQQLPFFYGCIYPSFIDWELQLLLTKLEHSALLAQRKTGSHVNDLAMISDMYALLYQARFYQSHYGGLNDEINRKLWSFRMIQLAFIVGDCLSQLRAIPTVYTHWDSILRTYKSDTVVDLEGDIQSTFQTLKRLTSASQGNGADFSWDILKLAVKNLGGTWESLENGSFDEVISSLSTEFGKDAEEVKISLHACICSAHAIEIESKIRKLQDQLENSRRSENSEKDNLLDQALLEAISKNDYNLVF